MKLTLSKSSLQSIFWTAALTAVLMGGYLTFAQARQYADHQAHVQAIREGRLTLQSQKEFLSTQEFEQLNAELEGKR